MQQSKLNNTHTIKFLLHRDIISATARAFSNYSIAKTNIHQQRSNLYYIKEIFKNRIYAYNRDDNAISALPALSVYSGGFSAVDNYNWEDGTIIIQIYTDLSYQRQYNQAMIENLGNILRNSIRNPNFHSLVVAYMYDLDNPINYKVPFNKDKPQDDIKTNYAELISKYNALARYGTNFKFTPGNNINLAEIGECFKSTITFNYRLELPRHEKFLMELGINDWADQNMIVYPEWRDIDLEVEAITNEQL